MEPREDSSLTLRSPFFSINMKPPQNPNHISRFPRPSSPQRINNYNPNSSLYNTKGFDLNHSNQSFHLTSRILGGGPTSLDGFSSNPFELGFSSFYANVFPYDSGEGVTKNVMHGGWGQYHNETRLQNNNNNDDDDDHDSQKAKENEAGASRVKVTERDDEYATNMAYMQHDDHDDDDDDVGKKKERGKKQEEDGEGGIIKGQWSAEEDRRLTELVEINGDKKWSVIARELKWREGKQCRERWSNHLRPEIKKTMWSEEEDKILIEAHKELGTKWSEITKRLPGRSENTIKNHWNATKRKRYLKRKSKGNIDLNVNESILLSNYIKSVEKSQEKKNAKKGALGNETCNPSRFERKNEKVINNGMHEKKRVEIYEKVKKEKGEENVHYENEEEKYKSRALFNLCDKEVYRPKLECTSWFAQLKVDAAARKEEEKYNVDATMERSFYWEFDNVKAEDEDDVDLIEMINNVKQH